MSQDNFDAFTLAQYLGAALDEAQIPYGIGGAIAFGIWGDPRGTHDVDINLFVNHDEFQKALAVLISAGVEIDQEAATKADLAGDVIVGWYEDIRVGLFTPSIPFAWEAMNHVVRINNANRSIAYLSAESIAVFKLLFFRPKDLLDVEKLIEVEAEAFDANYVRKWLVEMMGEGDERVVALDQMLSPPN